MVFGNKQRMMQLCTLLVNRLKTELYLFG